MNKDNIEGGVRKTVGQFEEKVGRAFEDKQTTWRAGCITILPMRMACWP